MPLTTPKPPAPVITWAIVSPVAMLVLGAAAEPSVRSCLLTLCLLPVLVAITWAATRWYIRRHPKDFE